MPRVIRRTVEPEKALACQSVDSRWTRAKPSCVTSCIIFSVRGVIAHQPRWRSTTIAAPRAVMTAKAAQAAPTSPRPAASMMRPA